MEKPHNGGHDHMQVAKLVGVLAAALSSSYTLHDFLSLSPLHYLSLIGNSLVPRPIPIPRISLCNIEILGMGLRGNTAIILLLLLLLLYCTCMTRILWSGGHAHYTYVAAVLYSLAVCTYFINGYLLMPLIQ